MPQGRTGLGFALHEPAFFAPETQPVVAEPVVGQPRAA